MKIFQFAIALSKENNVLVERIKLEKTKRAAKRPTLPFSGALKLQKRPSFSDGKLNSNETQRRI